MVDKANKIEALDQPTLLNLKGKQEKVQRCGRKHVTLHRRRPGRSDTLIELTVLLKES